MKNKYNLYIFLIVLLTKASVSSQDCLGDGQLDRFITTTVYVNFHFILDGNGEGNFRANDDGNNNSTITGYSVANDIIYEANETLASLEQNYSKKCSGESNGFVPDSKYRLQIYFDPNDNNQGVYFHSDQQLYDHSADQSPTFINDLKDQFTVYGDRVIDIFMFASIPGADCNVWGAAVGDGAACETYCLWYYHINNSSIQYDYEKLINHEVLHCIGLISEAQTIPGHSRPPCDLYDINGDEEALSTGNNIMKNNGGSKTALTPKQFNIIHNQLPKKAYSDQNIDCSTHGSPIVIPSNQTVYWDSPTKINSEVIVEPLATLIITCDVYTNSRILVQRSGKLIVEGAKITSLCPLWDFWPGIQVEGSTTPHSQVDPDAQLSSGDPGVVQLNGATIENAVVGVTANSDEHFWDKSYGGGIIQADVTTFIDNRKGLLSIPTENKTSHFLENVALAPQKVMLVLACGMFMALKSKILILMIWAPE
jgi:hypothetical protein